MNYRELNSPNLVKQWRTLVNDYVSMGRDTALMKDALSKYTPVQLLLGMYRSGKGRYASIPSFLRNYEDWLEEDDLWAEVELAVFITNHKPPDYYIYLDLVDEQNAIHHQTAISARIKLRAWAEEILTNARNTSLPSQSETRLPQQMARRISSTQRKSSRTSVLRDAEHDDNLHAPEILQDSGA